MVLLAVGSFTYVMLTQEESPAVEFSNTVEDTVDGIRDINENLNKIETH